jgi:glutaredoxin
MQNKVIIYTQNNCKYCQIVKNYLKDKDISYEARNMDDPEKGELYKGEHAQYGYQAAPVTVINGEAVVGFDLRNLNRLLG